MAPKEDAVRLVGKYSNVSRTPRIDISLPPLVSPDGNIRREYEALGGAAALGEAISRQPGIIWTLANGSCVCWNPDAGQAFEIHGAIYAKWLSLGGLNFGVPCTDEMPAEGTGRYNHFNSTTCSIYWTPNTGAAAIYSDIRVRSAELGYEYSYLGYPLGDEVDFAEGGRANEFQHGGIYWWPDTGPVDLRDVMEIYRGRPYGMNIGTVIMERDLGSLMPKLGEAISDLLDLGDETIGAAELTVPAKQMVLLAARTAMTDFWGIGYKLETGLVSGEGASCKAYFNVIPA